MNCPACGAENPGNSRFCNGCAFCFTGDTQTGQLSPDTVLENRYVIVKTLGRGGMGAVYMALDQRLNNRSVAIKEMSTHAVGGDLQAAIASFKKEASMLINLRHQALPIVHDFFAKGEDRWYLVMDYIEGQTLAEIARNRGPILEAGVVDWARQLCEILGYLHEQEPPIIFRDLKPANIMLTPKGQIKLIDFGIARHFRVGSSADTTAYGSHGFAPPEQYGENQTSPSSDIYALGATMHYLLTGIDPGKNPFMFDLPSKTVKVSNGTETAIMKALELKAEDRPKNMQEMLGLLLREANKAVLNEGGPATQGEARNYVMSEVQATSTNITIANGPAKDIPTSTVPMDSTEKGSFDSATTGNKATSIAGKPEIIRNTIIVVCLVLSLIYGLVALSHYGEKQAGVTEKKQAAANSSQKKTEERSEQLNNETKNNAENKQTTEDKSTKTKTANQQAQKTLGEAANISTNSTNANMTEKASESNGIIVPISSVTTYGILKGFHSSIEVVLEGVPDGYWVKLPQVRALNGDLVLGAPLLEDSNRKVVFPIVKEMTTDKSNFEFYGGSYYFPNGVPQNDWRVSTGGYF